MILFRSERSSGNVITLVQSFVNMGIHIMRHFKYFNTVHKLLVISSSCSKLGPTSATQSLLLINKTVSGLEPGFPVLGVPTMCAHHDTSIHGQFIAYKAYTGRQAVKRVTKLENRNSKSKKGKIGILSKKQENLRIFPDVFVKLRQIRHRAEWLHNTSTHPDPVKVITASSVIFELMNTYTSAGFQLICWPLGRIHNVFSNFLRNFNSFFYIMYNELPPFLGWDIGGTFGDCSMIWAKNILMLSKARLKFFKGMFSCAIVRKRL